MEGAPGEVVAVEPNGFVVAAQGGSIFVKRVQPEGSAKVKAPEFVQAVGLQVGDKFGV